MALVVSTLKPNLDPEFAINTTTSGVNADVVHITDDDLLARTGPSQAFSKACIDGRGMDVSSPYLPDIAGNWTLAYIVQYFSPSEGGRYTYEGDKVCLSPPMNGKH